jgi:hypothetical protein
MLAYDRGRSRDERGRRRLTVPTWSARLLHPHTPTHTLHDTKNSLVDFFHGYNHTAAMLASGSPANQGKRFHLQYITL